MAIPLLDVLKSHPYLSLPLIYLLYFLLRSIYRLTLHPLSSFPGPKFCAISRIPEFYHEVIRGGRFSSHIAHLHSLYGPIVRVTPNELHINDPAFYDRLYNFSPSIDRPIVTLNNLQNSPTFDLHKARRRVFEPYFSKQAVSKLEPLIRENVDALCSRFRQTSENGEVASVTLLARCFTADVICEYVFRQPYGFLKDPAKGEAFFGSQDFVFKNLWLYRETWQFYWFMNLMGALPQWVVGKDGNRDALVAFAISCKERLDVAKMRSKTSPEGQDDRPFYEQYQYSDVPDFDKSDQRQLDTAMLLISAGFETTGFTIETACFHLLTNKSLLHQLKQELMDAWPEESDMPSLTALERLPYLKAVVQESLRLSLGVASRLPRANREEALSYGGYVIPKDTWVSMSISDLHFNPQIFPNPQEFDPSRWLKGEESVQLSKYLVSFSKGARRCLGIHLAHAELYLALAAMFRRFDMELFETTRRDVDAKLDFFIPKPETDNGVRVHVKG